MGALCAFLCKLALQAQQIRLVRGRGYSRGNPRRSAADSCFTHLILSRRKVTEYERARKMNLQMRNKLLQSNNALLSSRKSGFGKMREKVQLSPWRGVQNAVRLLEQVPFLFFCRTASCVMEGGGAKWSPGLQKLVFKILPTPFLLRQESGGVLDFGDGRMGLV